MDGGKDSDWVKYESFVKMTAFKANNQPTATEGPGHPMWTETQSSISTTIQHSPIVSLIFGAADYYTTSIIPVGIAPTGLHAPGKLRKLPINNLASADPTLRPKVSIFGGINVNSDSTLIARWPP